MGGPGADAPTDAYVEDLDGLVAALRQDPVNVQQVTGNGHTAEVDAALTEIVASSEVPTYVALLGDLSGLAVDRAAEDLAVRLQSRVDPDAVYIIAVGGSSTAWFYEGEDPDLTSAIYEGLEPTYPSGNYDSDAPRASDAGQAAIIATVVAADDHTISDSLADTYRASPTWTGPRYEPSRDAYLPSEVAGLSLLVGVFVALTAWRLTRTWALRAVVPAPAPGARRTAVPRKRERPATAPAPRDEAPDLDAVRRQASDTLDTLADELVSRPSGPGADEALGCRVAAESVLGSDDLLDVVGALVLARTGRKLLTDSRRAYRPCFLNPLHGLGYVETAAPVGGGDGSVSVPVCRRCSKVTGTNRAYEPLLEPPSGWRRRDPRPYYEGDTVWARTGFGSLDTDLWRRVMEERS